MANIPRPEHPRPDLFRGTWQNLNGEWEFAVDSSKSGLEKGWHTGEKFPRRIMVPFCPESKLSGIGETDFLEAVWYRRTFRIADDLKGKRLLLHFGAVDYDARVWVNGKQVARHRGGYTPFSAEITDAVNMDGENEIVVYAEDDIRSNVQPSGKQSHYLKSYSCLYTRTTGIWQTVWVEGVGDSFISNVTVWPDALNERVSIEVSVKNVKPGAGLKAVISAEGKETAAVMLAQTGAHNVLSAEIPDAVLWNPLEPYLYDVELSIVEGGDVIDSVETYFGLRDVRIEGDRILINGKAVYQRLILDQGFWPDGIYTAPSDEEIQADIDRSIAMGFNGARLHEKVFEPRTLYWADKKGYLIWGEFPDWGTSLRFTAKGPNFFPPIDHFEHLPTVHAQARENFLREWLEAVLRDRSHPCVVAWTPLNEAHSNGDRYDPEFAQTLYDLTKKIDPSRPIVDASGYTHVITDIWDLHDYDQNPASFGERYDKFGENPTDENLAKNDREKEPPYAGQPVIVSEYGGIWWNPEQADAEFWGYGDRPKSEKEFLERFEGLTKVLMDNPHMAGLCYTQLTDVELEVNGLYTYDREPKFDAEAISAVLKRKAAIEEG